MPNEITAITKETTDLQNQFNTLSANISAVTANISNAFTSISQTVTTTFKSMTSGVMLFKDQLLDLCRRDGSVDNHALRTTPRVTPGRSVQLSAMRG